MKIKRNNLKESREGIPTYEKILLVGLLNSRRIGFRNVSRKKGLFIYEFRLN